MIFNVEIAEGNIAFWMQGLRAFLPLKEFINRPKTLEDYVSQRLIILLLCILIYVLFLKDSINLNLSSFLYRRAENSGWLLLLWTKVAIVWL